MAEETLTYDPDSAGWTSRWSYRPDWMLGMNSSFYSWSNGSLHKHHSNALRNNFYGVQYDSSITSVFSQDPLSEKVFKTLCLKSTSPWLSEITTDLQVGEIATTYYREKEGQWYAHIRKIDDDTIETTALSTQGIGSLLSYNALVLTFSFNIGSSISQGDKVYVFLANSFILLGVVASHTATTITLDSIGATIPSTGQMIAYTKNNVAESNGTRGYFAEVKLTNTSTDQEDIFAIVANVFKSYP